MTSVDDPYRALGVEPTATPEEIQIAFRRVIRSVHPDRHVDAPADHAEITRLVEAWHVLGDPARRADFDRTRRSPEPLIWQPAADHQVSRTASLVRLFIVTAIATASLLTGLFIIAMTQSG